jgi:hypothetical protein
VSRTLNGLGRVDLTNDLDTIRVNNQYKLHGLELSTNLLNFYNNIVTVSDVYTAFKELSNGGIFGNESGLEFTSGVQFINADVNDDNIFDERDTYKLLQHLIGTDVIGGGSNNLSDYIKMYLKTDYDFINKTNWNSQINKTGNVYTPLILNNLASLNTFNFSLTWKGDVNLSHSAQQSTNLITNSSSKNMISNNVSNEILADIMGEMVNNKIYITIKLEPLQNELVGTQFQLNYDNTKLKFEKVEFE